MSNVNLAKVVEHLRRLVSPSRVSDSDHSLLARFLDTRDEEAFAHLLKRHGPMVFGVSRRLVNRVQDAEDVVQATFLLLARKAASIRKRASLGSWLHGVAQRLSIQLMRQEMNRLKRETRASVMRGQAESPQHTSQEIQELLDVALAELPEKYRAALILCYLEDNTQEEAAAQLGCPLGTVRSRLARGRKLLEKRLAARGLALSSSGIATFLTVQTAKAALPAKLFASALHAAVQYASGETLTGLVSASIGLLVNNGLKSAALTKMLWVSAGILTLGVLAGGAGLAARSVHVANPEAQIAQPSRERQRPEDDQRPKNDLYGDPLPPGALARLGTIRFRQGDLVHNLAFSSDGKNLLSADGYGVYIWDAATGTLLRRLGDHRDQWSISHASFAADGTMALATKDGNIDIMDGTTGRVLRHVDSKRFPHVALSPDGQTLAVDDHQGGKEDHSLRLIDVGTGAERHKLLGHQDRIHAIVFSKNSKSLITSSDDKTIRFWDVGSGQQVRQLNHSTLVGPIAPAPDGKTLASLDMTKTEHKMKNATSIMWASGRQIVMWDLLTNKVTHRLEHKKWPNDSDMGPVNQVNGIVFSPDSKTLVSSDRHGTHFWDLATAKELPERTLPTTWGSAMAFRFDGGTLATGGYESVRLWDMSTGKEKLPLDGHLSWVQGVAISPDGKTIATGGSDKRTRIWDTATGRETRQLGGHEYGVGSVDFALDGRLLVSTGFNDPVKVWEVATGKELHRFPGSHATLSPDGRLLVTCSKEAASTASPDVTATKAEITNTFFCVWELATGKEIRKWLSVRNDYSPLAFSSDGKMVYSWDSDKKVRLWEVATGKELHHFEGKALRADSSPDDFDRIFRWAFSSDSKLVALGNQSDQIAIFDMATGEQIKFLSSRWGSLSAMAFSADSRQLASGHWQDKDVHLWEIASGQEFQQLAGHNGRILSLASSADGRMLLSGNTDTTALLWDLTGTRTAPKAQPLTAKDLKTVWSDLSSLEATRGQKAVRTLLAVPEQAMALLGRELKPATTPDAKRLARSIADLDSEVFKTREDAVRELERLGDVAAPALRKAIADNPTLETKQRLESLLEKFSSSQRLRTLRAVQALELLGTPASHELLARLAGGVPEALLTREARTAVARLAKRL